MASISYLRALGTGPIVGQVLTTKLHGLTIQYKVMRVTTPTDITVELLSCVATPQGAPFKVEVFNETTGRWAKVAECSSREEGTAYLKATGRSGLVSENR